MIAVFQTIQVSVHRHRRSTGQGGAGADPIPIPTFEGSSRFAHEPEPSSWAEREQQVVLRGARALASNSVRPTQSHRSATYTVCWIGIENQGICFWSRDRLKPIWRRQNTDISPNKMEYNPDRKSKRDRASFNRCCLIRTVNCLSKGPFIRQIDKKAPHGHHDSTGRSVPIEFVQ